jgi:membrane-associated protein
MMEFLHQLVDWVRWLIFDLAKPDNLRKLVSLGGAYWVSYAILTAIVFSETGLLVGFFLPGDSLLFAAGFLASQGVFDLTALLILLSVAGIVGDTVNYLLGRRMGEYVFEKGRLRWVKHEHLIRTRAFYHKYGAAAIVLARFVPIVRTFTPFVAGVARMHYRTFLLYNIAGGVGWVFSMSLAGYFLGQIPVVQSNFEKVVIGIVVVSVLPLVIAAWKASRGQRPEAVPTS